MIRVTLTTAAVAASLPLALGLAFLAGRSTSPAAITPAAQPEGQMSPEQVKAMMAEGAAKTAEHETLARFIGAWNAEAGFLAAPGAEPETSRMTADFRPILDGRFIQNHYKGTFRFMGADIPFEGYGVLGFDKHRGLYVTSWVDNLSTSLLVEKGEPGDQSDRITVEGEMMNQMGGDSKIRHVWILNNDGSFTLEFHQQDPASGQMMKVGWINHTKK